MLGLLINYQSAIPSTTLRQYFRIPHIGANDRLAIFVAFDILLNCFLMLAILVAAAKLFDEQ